MSEGEETGFFVHNGETTYDMRNPEQRDAFVKILEGQPREYRDKFMERLHAELSRVVQSVGCYAGIPLIDPDSGVEVIGRSRNPIEDKYFTRNLAHEEDEPLVTDDGYLLINAWTTPAKNGIRTRVEIWDKDGKRYHTKTDLPPDEEERMYLLFRSVTIRLRHHRVHAEKVAHDKLLTMLSERQHDSWILSSCFVEQGSSGMYYLVRKGLPTFAFRMQDGRTDAIATLCFHPLAYYGDSFAGAMVPSDEAIAHLLFIRGDERGFWKRAHHHPLSEPRSGI